LIVCPGGVNSFALLGELDEQGGKPIKDFGDANLIGESETGPTGYARCVNFRSQPTIYSENRLSTDTPR
jgi:hypothetical protein